jgi:hypothetical protein
MEEKVSLPIKTKIAAWWMIVSGGVGVFLMFFFGTSLKITWWGLFLLHMPIFWAFLFIQFFFFLAGLLLLLLKKKWCWWFAIITSIVATTTPIIIFGEYPPILIPLAIIWTGIPFILLLLDHKNFWKVAR